MTIAVDTATKESVFRPKSLTALRGYTQRQFSRDVSAGIIVGVIAVPLSIAVAVASGVSPQQGLTTAIIAGIVVALFGGGRVQVSGPTGTFIVISYAIAAQYGYDGLALATILAALMLIGMGVAGFGKVIQFIPYPIVVGFTSGIATVILISQFGDLTGMSLADAPPDTIERIATYFREFSRIRPLDTILAVITIFVTAWWKQVSRRIPGALVAILVVTVPVAIFELPAVTIGSRFGALPRTLEWYGLPELSLPLIQELAVPAFTIALLCGIESLFTALVTDGMVGDRHESDTELIAEGGANLLVALFGGIPTSGAIARTATSAKNGGRTPIAAATAALFVFVVLAVLGPLAAYIPLAALAGILSVVAWNMAEWRTLLALARGPKSDMTVLLVTFILTVLIDLAVAIQVGMVLAAFLFMRRMSIVSDVTLLNSSERDVADVGGTDALASDEAFSTIEHRIPEDVEVYEIDGALFFGVAEKFRNTMLLIERRPRVRIVRMRNVTAIDLTGLRLLEDLVKDSRHHGHHFILSGLKPQPERALRKSGLYDTIRAENVTRTLWGALARAEQLKQERHGRDR